MPTATADGAAAVGGVGGAGVTTFAGGGVRIGRGAAPRAGLLAGRVGVTGLLKKEDPVLSAEVGVICPEP